MVQQPVAQLPWSHHIILLNQLGTRDERLWYAAKALENGWSRNVLDHQIRARLRERSGKALTNFAAAIPPPDSDLAQQVTRDAYLFDFAGKRGHERDLEQALIEHVSSFLLEIGQGFAYVGRQVRLEIGDQDFY